MAPCKIMGRAIDELGWPRHTFLVSSKYYWGLDDTVNARNTLNRKYLRKDKVTDVLAFADNDALGDLAIATGVARRQARDAGHSYQTELRVLALHGLLHLLGYDHHNRHDDGRMGRVEAALRRKGGLATGLIERTSAPRASAKSRRVGA